MSLTTTPTKPAAKATQRGGKFLTFALGDEQYGIQILKVREIVGYTTVTPVPCVSSCVKGVINLHGQIISVIDLRVRLEMPETPRTQNTCIIVVESPGAVAKGLAGIIVDRVCEVLEIPQDDIEDAPTLAAGISTDFIAGIAKVNSSVKILLEIEKVLRPVVSSLAAVSQSASAHLPSERTSQ